jgi:hypothetical protein
MEGSVKMSKEFTPMCNAAADVEALNGMARSLERSEVRRSGTGVLQARKSIARRIGITPAALENFRYLRTKVVPSWLMGRVREELISVLQLEVRNLEQEIQLHLQAGSDHSGSALVEAETSLASAREILRQEIKG